MPASIRHAIAGRLTVLALLAALPCATVEAGTGVLTELLRAEFETQALDAPVGTGGAAAGEPVSYSAGNRIVEYGITGHGLELQDTGVSTAVSMRFEFLEDQEMTSGLLYVSVWLEAQVLDSFYIRLRENGSSTTDYGQVMLTTAGAVRVEDETGNLGDVAPVGTIAAGNTHFLEWVHDLDAGTYSLFLDDTPLVEDRAHGQDGGPDGRGIGAVLFGFFSDATTDGVIEIDTLEVYTNVLPPREDPVFRDGFEL